MKGSERVGAVIAAAGLSQRMAGVDKIFADLDGAPVLSHVIDTFERCKAIDQVVIIVSQQNLDMGIRLRSENRWLKVTDVGAGGGRRQDSVVNGLSLLTGCEWVVIHDGARPLVTADLIERGLEAAAETGAAIAAVPVTDTVKVAAADMTVEGTPPRRSLWSVQTPQVFRFSLIDQAYRKLGFEVPDDASALERLGHKVKIYQGSYDNIKITTPDDLAVAGVLWRKRG
jgi:2-C-methyl-D-erythritol 4-phosphate cytidylyltransferase